MTNPPKPIKMVTQPDYVIYPSLLIGFQKLLDYEQVAEEPWNFSDGEYKLTPDEMYVKLEADLINMINRVEGEPIEAADKGTAFNEIVDCLIENRKSSIKDCIISTAYSPIGQSVLEWINMHKSEIGENAYYRTMAILNKERRIRADINGFTFEYDMELCRQTADYFKGSVTQFKAEGSMETKFGLVRFYGYIDEWVGNKMYDIKTTSRYNFGKFENGWQRHVYPWCVIEAGLTTEIESFTYLVVEWAYQRKGEPITAKNVYEETYSYNHKESGDKIKDIAEKFIEWLLSRRELIQDKKIFGGTNPEGWRGIGITEEELANYTK